MHTEAPASVTFSATSPKGYGVLFTVRGEKGGDLLTEMEAIESGLSDGGYTPKGQSYGGAKPKESGYTKKSSGYSGSGATPKQKQILVDWGLWEEDMSKTKASEIIGNRLGK